MPDRQSVAREALYISLVVTAKDAIISIDEQQNIVLFNPAAEVVFRCSAREAVGQPLDRFLPASARATHRRHIERFDAHANVTDAAQATHAMGGGERILSGVRADGEVFPIDASISKADTPAGKVFTVILRDVTVRERNRQTLQRYADIVELSSDAIISRAPDGRIMTWNAAAEHIFGYTRDEAVCMTIDNLYSPRTPPEHCDLTLRVMQGCPVVNLETIRRHKDGRDIDVAVSLSLLRDSEGRVSGSSAVYRDITQRVRLARELHDSLQQQKRAEAALRESRDSLRELSAALQSIREEEKTRIARELHDELGQMLTALKMDASAIADDLLPTQEALARRAQDMKQVIDATVRSVRRISADLRPMMLDNLGLAPTLEWLTQGFAERTGIEVDLAMPNEDLGASGDAATAVFRIVQEALTNVARHAQATQVQVSVLRVAGNVRVRVTDNGVGLGDNADRETRSFGVLGMRERAYVLGGEFSISSAPDKGKRGTTGTSVEATIPAFGTVRGRTS